jgi:hypothetical protein
MRSVENNVAGTDDFLNCADRACFSGLKRTRLIASKHLDKGGEKVLYTTWSGATWKNYQRESKGKYLYLYFEAHFDDAGSVLGIKVGEPLCTLGDNYKKDCRILTAF